MTKIHYKLWIREWQTISAEPKPTNYHIISLTGRSLDNIDTILNYTWWARYDRNTSQWQEWNNPYTYNYTWNNYMNIPLWSGIHIYTIPWSLTSYPIVFQIYNTWNYYFTHEYKTDLTRNDLTFTLSPSNYCLPASNKDTEIVHMIWKWNRYERDTTWFNANSLTISNNWTYLSNTFNHNSQIINFRKTGTWTYERNLTFPCQQGELCYATITFQENQSRKVEDILHFKRWGRHSITYTYTRDRRAPELTIDTGSITECKTKSIKLYPSDTCAWINTYEVFSETLNIHRTWILYNWATITWLDIGRTWNIDKTWWVKTRDNYNNSYLWNILERNFKIHISDAPVTISKWKTKNDHLKYTWDIPNHYYMTWWYAEITWFITGADDAEIIVNPIELLWAQEWDCGTWDLYVDNVQCYTWNLAFSDIDPRFNFTWDVLTWQIIIENWKKTQRVKIFHENKKTFDIVTCAFNIKDNETWAWVTWYIWFRINTLHVPLIDPEIVSWTKYIDYAKITWDRYEYTHHENQKYSSWNKIYIDLHANDCVYEYYASCRDYYDWTGINETNQGSYTTWIRRHHELYTGFDLTECEDGIENFSGTETPIKISVRNWEFTWDNGFFTNTWNTEDIIYDYTSPTTTLMKTDNQIIIANWQTMTIKIIVNDKFNINDRLVNDNWQLSNTWLVKLTINTWSCPCQNQSNNCFADIQAWFQAVYGIYNTRILTITWIVNVRDDKCEGWNIHIKIDSWFVNDFALNDSTLLDEDTDYIYTNKTAIYLYEWIRKRGTEDQRVATKNIERISITWKQTLILLSNLPFNQEDLYCTWYDQTWHFICLSLTDSWTINQINEEICKERNKEWNVPSCNYTENGNVIFNQKYEVWFTICSWYSSEIGGRVWECTGHYSTNDTTWTSIIYGNLRKNNNRYNEDYAKIILYRQKSPFKAWQTQNETFFYWELIKALQDGNGDNWFIFYISHPQKIRTWNISGWTIWAISYDLNFSSWVADEFYYITWEAIVNWFKQSRSIKRPTYNYENPKGYLFNFPDYENYE